MREVPFFSTGERRLFSHVVIWREFPPCSLYVSVFVLRLPCLAKNLKNSCFFSARYDGNALMKKAYTSFNVLELHKRTDFDVRVKQVSNCRN